MPLPPVYGHVLRLDDIACLHQPFVGKRWRSSFMTFVNPNNLYIAVEWAEGEVRRAKEDEVEAILAREAAEEKLARLRKELELHRSSGGK